MSQLTGKWRPSLFSALGEGFIDDSTLNDGFHLRWIMDPRLGLPIVSKSGQFKVYELNRDGYQSIVNSKLKDLINIKINSKPLLNIQVSSKQKNTTGKIRKKRGERYYFTKPIESDLRPFFEQYMQQKDIIDDRISELEKEDQEFIIYMQSMIEAFLPKMELDLYSLVYEDAVAVDFTFKIQGHTRTPTQPLPFNHRRTTYAIVKGYDRENRLIDSDWIGIYANKKEKLSASLRAPGISYFTIEQKSNQPEVTPEMIYWLFCEDYCRANYLWQDVTKIKNEQYDTPFKIKKEGIEEKATKFISDLQKEFNPKGLKFLDTYNTFTPCSKDNNDDKEFCLPLFPILLQSTIDPMMARILELYWHTGQLALPKNSIDFMVEADLPFFAEKNLRQLRERYKEICDKYNDIIPDKLFGDIGILEEKLSKIVLCGLVLNPTLKKQPLAIMPDPRVNISNIDLPPSEDSAKTTQNPIEILVNSSLKFPLNRNELKPYLQPVCYEIKRKIGNSDFTNSVQSDDNIIEYFDDIGLLPPVYVPAEDEENTEMAVIKDFFALPELKSESLQYRLNCFDIFGRPSMEKESPEYLITVPCYQPLPLSNVSGYIVEDKEEIVLHLTFSIVMQQAKLEAQREQLEILIVKYPSDTSCTEIKTPFEHYAKASNDVISMSLEFEKSGTKINVVSSVFNEEITTELDKINIQKLTGAISIENRTDLDPGLHKWCIYFRIRGKCKEGTKTLYSNEQSINAQLNITPPLTKVIQPKIEAIIPLSTYPDYFGKGYFTIDLRDFIDTTVTDVNSEPMFNIYTITLDVLTDKLEPYVQKEKLLDQKAFLELVGKSRYLFERLTLEPVIYTEQSRYYRVQVQANLEQYHVVAVVGTNEYMEEGSWKDSGMILFKTPYTPSPATLFFIEGKTTTDNQSILSKLLFRAKVPSKWISLEHPVKIQVLRQDISTGTSLSSFRHEVDGIDTTPDVNNDDRHTVYFTFEEKGLSPFQIFRYEAYLLIWDAQRQQYIKQHPAVECQIKTNAIEGFSPFENPDDLKIIPMIKKGFVIQMKFDAGEFSFLLQKEGTDIQFSGTVSQGKVSFDEPNVSYRFDAGKRYQLSITDKDENPANYTLQLKSHTHNQVWIKKAEVKL